MIPPTCSCGDPATTQHLVGTGRTPAGWTPRYAWMCEPCGRDLEAEREIARSS